MINVKFKYTWKKDTQMKVCILSLIFVRTTTVTLIKAF